MESSREGESEESQGAASAYIRLKHEALGIERQTLLELRNAHAINDEVLRRIQHELDLAEDHLRSRGER